jgi:O-antigen/teichoic acid export membrane protein
MNSEPKFDAATGQAPAEAPDAAPKQPEPKRNNFVSDVFSVLMARVLTKALQFLIGLVSARLVGPEGRGLIAALGVAPELVLTFSQFGVRQAVAYHIGKNIYSVPEIVPTLFGLALASSVTGGAACLVYYYFTGLLDNDYILIIIALAPIPFSLLTNYISGVLLGKELIVRFNRINWVPMALNLVLVIAIGWAAGTGVFGIMLAALTATVLSAGYAIWLLRALVPIRIGFDAAVARKLTRLGIVYAVSLFLLTLSYRLPILLLQGAGNLHEVGIYTVGQSLAYLVWEVPALVSNLIFSRGVNSKDEAVFSEKVALLTRLVVLAGVIVAIGCAVVGPFAIPLLYGEEFRRSADVLTILLPGTVAFMAFKVIHMDIASRGRPWLAMTVVAPCIIANAGIAWFFVADLGAESAAAITSAGYVVATVAYLVIYARVCEKPVLQIIAYRMSDFRMLRERLAQALQRRRPAKEP